MPTPPLWRRPSLIGSTTTWALLLWVVSGPALEWLKEQERSSKKLGEYDCFLGDDYPHDRELPYDRDLPDPVCREFNRALREHESAVYNHAYYRRRYLRAPAFDKAASAIEMKVAEIQLRRRSEILGSTDIDIPFVEPPDLSMGVHGVEAPEPDCQFMSHVPLEEDHVGFPHRAWAAQVAYQREQLGASMQR